MYAHLTPRIKNAYLGKKLGATLEQMRRTAEGSIAPDFTLTTPDGQELSLASLRGNYVLVDFWASWCGPCLREVPNVKKIYDKFHDKGFEIIGVSLDEDKEAWINAIDKHGLNWKHVSSLKGWNCPVAQLYSVTGIPAMFLLDKDGKIVLKSKVTEDDAVLCSASIDSKGRVTIPYNMLYLMNLEIGSEVSIWEFNGIIYIEKLGT